MGSATGSQDRPGSPTPPSNSTFKRLKALSIHWVLMGPNHRGRGSYAGIDYNAGNATVLL